LIGEYSGLTLGLTTEEKNYFYYSFVFIEIYATLHTILYLPKMLGILGIFAYCWYWGGFEKNDQGQSTSLQCLEKILEESNFEADNVELPENLDAAHKIIVKSIVDKV
jgi:hypothetical protein